MENIQFRQRNSFNNVAQAFSQKRTEIPTGLNEKTENLRKINDSMHSRRELLALKRVEKSSGLRVL